MTSEYEATRERQREEASEGLRREWGDSFDAKLGVAQAAFQSLTGNESDRISVARLADGRVFGDQPEIVRLFAAVGSARLTSDEARRELYRLENEEPTKSILLDSMHPGREAIMLLRSALHKAKAACG